MIAESPKPIQLLLPVWRLYRSNMKMNWSKGNWPCSFSLITFWYNTSIFFVVTHVCSCKNHSWQYIKKHILDKLKKLLMVSLANMVLISVYGIRYVHQFGHYTAPYLYFRVCIVLSIYNRVHFINIVKLSIYDMNHPVLNYDPLHYWHL